MLETLKQIDSEWFLSINNGWQNAFMDWLCPWLRQPKTWIPLYIIALWFAWKIFGKQALWVAVGAGLLILVSDQFSANLIKNTFERLRPCNDPILKNKVHLLAYCGGGYSFISAHATNHFAIAVYFSLLFKNTYPRMLPYAILWAASIAISQVYVGVHYPFDIICGAIVGSIFGYFGSVLISKIINKNK
ncbi:MAG: phosphatase PAP2 family protein [Bacteroidia bacterium]|nr:phosphatase PAP2 family protein [Bacteroidia bacterium]